MSRGTRPNRIALMEREIASSYRKRIDELEATQRGILAEHSHHVSRLHAELGDVRIENKKLTEKLAATKKQRNAIAWELVATALPELSTKVPPAEAWATAVAPYAWGLPNKEPPK